MCVSEVVSLPPKEKQSKKLLTSTGEATIIGPTTEPPKTAPLKSDIARFQLLCSPYLPS